MDVVLIDRLGLRPGGRSLRLLEGCAVLGREGRRGPIKNFVGQHVGFVVDTCKVNRKGRPADC